MLHGRFGESSGRPYVAARVVIPRLGLAGNVSFLFDTGADSTVLMPADAATLGVDYALLANPSESFGIGGTAATYIEAARLAFADSGGERVYGYGVSLRIHHPTDDAMRVPSLLGRDVIDRWRVTYDKSVPTLAAEVLSCDAEFRIDEGGGASD